MKTYEEILIGLACVSMLDPSDEPCGDCPYWGDETIPCGVKVAADALVLLQQLKADNARLQSSYDATKKDLIRVTCQRDYWKDRALDA